MTAFVDIDYRYDIRCDLEQWGATCIGYNNGGAQFYMPRLPELREFFLEECAQHDLEVTYGLGAKDRPYFPVTSQSVPKYQRHDASYPGSRGFTLTWTVTPKA